MSNQKVTYGVSVTTFVHDHSKCKMKKPAFSEAMKQEIFTVKSDFAMKPKMICKQLKRTHPNEPVPTVPNIRNILQQQKKANIAETVTYGQFSEWCEKEKEHPDNDDTAFVLDYIQNPDDDSFAFVVSTIRLLKNCANRDNACADATYKIVWQNFPIIAVGFLDRLKHFHLIALRLTAKETTNDYSFVFDSIRTAVFNLTGTDFCPKVLISDAAPAIRNAFYGIFESAQQNVICYIHVQRNIAKAEYRSKENKEAIMKDFLVLQKAVDETEFDIASNLFLQKWNTSEPKFCKYFENQWLQTNTKNWYAGYSPFVPDHNNGQEGFNNHIKRDHTLRERLHLNEFKIKLLQMVSDMSNRYDPDNFTGEVKKIQDEPIVTDTMYQQAHAWYKDANLIIGEKKQRGDTQVMVVSSSKYTKQGHSDSLDELVLALEKVCDTFDEFVSDVIGMAHTITMKLDKTTCLKESTCTCRGFQTNFICKHIIGLAFHKKLLKIPKRANSKLFKRKLRKVEHPKQKKP